MFGSQLASLACVKQVCGKDKFRKRLGTSPYFVLHNTTTVDFNRTERLGRSNIQTQFVPVLVFFQHAERTECFWLAINSNSTSLDMKDPLLRYPLLLYYPPATAIREQQQWIQYHCSRAWKAILLVKRTVSRKQGEKDEMDSNTAGIFRCDDRKSFSSQTAGISAERDRMLCYWVVLLLDAHATCGTASENEMLGLCRPDLEITFELSQ